MYRTSIDAIHTGGERRNIYFVEEKKSSVIIFCQQNGVSRIWCLVSITSKHLVHGIIYVWVHTDACLCIVIRKSYIVLRVFFYLGRAISPPVKRSSSPLCVCEARGRTVATRPRANVGLSRRPWPMCSGHKLDRTDSVSRGRFPEGKIHPGLTLPGSMCCCCV